MRKVYRGPFCDLNLVNNEMVVEPMAGHTDEEIINLLTEFGIDSEIFIPGFVSSKVTRAQLDALGEERYTDLSNRLQAIGRISPKVQETLSYAGNVKVE